MAYLLHYHRDNDEPGKPIEYIVLAGGDVIPEQDEYAEDGYDCEVFELDAMSMTGDWPATLPLDRVLIEERARTF